MKLNGALMPHGANQMNGNCSIGAKNKYCDKIYISINNNNSINNTKNYQKSFLVFTNNKTNKKIQSERFVGGRQHWNQNMNCENSSNTKNSNRMKEKAIKTSSPVVAMPKKIALVRRRTGGGGKGYIYNTNIMLRVQQSLFGYGFSSSSFSFLILCLFYIMISISNPVYCDDNNNDNNFFLNHMSQGPEMTTPEFDYASRGNKKFGDKCNNTLECGFPGSICDPKKKSCQCTEDLQITNHIDKCGKEAAYNESCFFNEQCESYFFQTECRDGRCICRFELQAVMTNGKFDCVAKQGTHTPEQYVDPAMIGVLVGMALMFIIICVVLRLFSQARWHENRTIFNTPNPRLMNVSLLRESKLLHGQERRGSRMSVRGPSRQPSMASLRPHSPNPSLASRSGSRGSNASGHSFRSRSDSSNAHHTNNHHHHSTATAATAAATGSHHHHQHHNDQHRKNSIGATQQPLIEGQATGENVTVEIVESQSKNGHTDI